MKGPDDPAARHERLTSLFAQALELPESERPAFLARECAGEHALIAELEDLLEQQAREVELLDRADDPQRRGGLVAMLADADEHWIGCEVGGCTLLELLGAGGMGSVYRARQARPQREVALKLLRSGVLGDSALRRFEVETRLLAHLQHPGIAKVYAAGVHEEGPLRLPYCTLELIEGGRSITTYADEQRLDVRARLALFLQACDALQHAHERRVIHRDVKPDNLLVDRSGQVRVIDFGIARVLEDQEQGRGLTRTGHLLGTPAYMSPEQVEGRADELDTRADVYSLGVVLYQLLCGRLPIDVDGASLLEVSRRILEEEPRRLSTLRASLRGDLETIALKALAKDPQRRYASAGALAADLRRFLSDEPISARPATALYQLTKFARRHRGLTAGAVLAVSALVTGAGLALWSAAQAFEARDQARRLAYDASLSAAASALQLGDSEAARRRLDAAPQALRGWEWRHFRARLDDASLVLPAEPASGALGNLRRVAFASDSAAGEQLLSVTAVIRDGAEYVELKRISALDGAELTSWSSGPHKLIWPNLGFERLWVGTLDEGALQFDLSGRRLAALDLSSAWPRSGRVALIPLDAERAIALRRLGGPHRVVDFARGVIESPSPLSDDELMVVVLGPSADGRALVSFGRSVCWTPFDSSAPRECMEWSGEPVNVFAAHPDGERIYAAGQDGSLSLVRRGAGGLQLERRIAAHVDAIGAIALSPDGALLATGGKDRSVRVFDTAELAPLSTLFGAESSLVALSFSGDGARIAAVEASGAARIFDAPRAPDPRVLRGPKSYLYSLELSPDERWIATGDWDGCVRLWDRESGELVASYTLIEGPVGHVESLSWSPDGRSLAAIAWSGRGDVQAVWIELSSGLVQRLPAEGDQLSMRAVCALDAERYVAANRNSVRCFSRASGELLAKVELSAEILGDDVWSLRWRARRSPDGQRFAVGFSSGWVTIIGSGDLRVESAWLAHEGPVHDVAWSRDGLRLASAGADRSARVFDARDGRELAALAGHAAAVFGVAFAPDGSRLFTCSDDRTVRVWAADGGRELAQLVGHLDYVFSLDCGSDGRVVSCSGDRTLRLWDERTRAQLLAARSERAQLAARLGRRVEDELARSGPEAAYDALERASDLSPRERDVALQLLVARSAKAAASSGGEK